MQVNDIIRRHINLLSDAISSLPSRHRDSVRIIDSWARGDTSILTFAGDYDKTMAFVKGVQTDSANAHLLLCQIHGTIAAQDEHVPIDGSAREVRAAMVRLVYGSMRPLNTTLTPKALSQHVDTALTQMFDMHPQIYTLLLWVMIPALSNH